MRIFLFVMVLRRRGSGNIRFFESKNRKCKGERAALLPASRGPDTAALSHHQLLTDVQTQAEPFATRFSALRDLIEALKNLLRYLGADSAARVGHFYGQVAEIFLERP